MHSLGRAHGFFDAGADRSSFQIIPPLQSRWGCNGGFRLRDTLELTEPVNSRMENRYRSAQARDALKMGSDWPVKPVIRQMGAVVASAKSRSTWRLRLALPILLHWLIGVLPGCKRSIGTTLTSRNSPSGLQAHAAPLELRASAEAKLASAAEPLRVRAPASATEAQGPPKGSRRQGRPKQWFRSHGRRDSPIRPRRRSLAPQERPVRPVSTTAYETRVQSLFLINVFW
jgi:hypothetical protein